MSQAVSSSHKSALTAFLPGAVGAQIRGHKSARVTIRNKIRIRIYRLTVMRRTYRVWQLEPIGIVQPGLFPRETPPLFGRFRDPIGFTVSFAVSIHRTVCGAFQIKSPIRGHAEKFVCGTCLHAKNCEKG